ncbi:ABC transporter substrate-binding protein [Chelatococcus reniformis]|uniref:Branched-chain amino acid ABC transporter substrate-binding protein n=1 Tax=Chelatococcus reniformis TaxID=1494448 RepID=A0A916XNJ0_9HYPH|nr:ABC transporter substrate-binding protein [Chelatococcus reniformis]GGC90004.1 branched-chain amino acid ABC transporter substrate-binding protein [Chelatococcus reniformis]
MIIRMMAFAAATFALVGAATAADKQYGPGASDTEIKIGNTMPYSGPASAYSVMGRVETAYFKKLNDRGGINGRKVNLISLDDAFSPPKTVEQTRRLVESEGVLAMYGSIGTATSAAVQKYLNVKKVPQILVSSGGTRWNDLKDYPWSMPFYPSYEMEAAIYGKYILAHKPDAKIAILSQNDDAGRDYVRGFKKGLGDKAASMVVAEVTYDLTDATIDSQIIKLKASGADTLFTMATPKFGAMAIRKVHELDWKPLNFVVSVASSIGSVLEPAGLDASQGLISAVSDKTPGDPMWKDAPDMKEFLAFMNEIGVESSDTLAVRGYVSAIMLHRILERAGDNLTRENIMRVATSIDEESLPMLLPGISVKTTPTDVSGFHSLRLQRFEGKGWVLFGDVITD